MNNFEKVLKAAEGNIMHEGLFLTDGEKELIKLRAANKISQAEFIKRAEQYHTKNYNSAKEKIKAIVYEREESYIKKEISAEEKAKRRKEIDDAIIISTLDAAPPSKENLELMDQYVEGEIELAKALEITLDKYKKLSRN